MFAHGTGCEFAPGECFLIKHSCAGHRHDFHTHSQYSFQICSQPETNSDVIPCRFVRRVVPDNIEKLHNSRLNCCREIRLQNRPRRHCQRFLFRANFRLVVASDVICSSAMNEVGLDVSGNLAILGQIST